VPEVAATARAGALTATLSGLRLRNSIGCDAWFGLQARHFSRSIKLACVRSSNE
jgi:hypothetical protein